MSAPLKRGRGRPPKVKGEPGFHPEAELFPLIEGPEFSELIADIKKNGLAEPIVLLGRQIIDGRNRYRACIEAGIKPDFIAGDKKIRNPTEYVLSRNLHRRHLGPKEKHDLVVKLLKAHPEMSDRSIARWAKVSPTTVGVDREKVEATVQIGQLSEPEPKRVGADGKRRRKPKKRAKSKDALFAAELQTPSNGMKGPENAGDPEASAEAMKAMFADGEAAVEHRQTPTAPEPGRAAHELIKLNIDLARGIFCLLADGKATAFRRELRARLEEIKLNEEFKRTDAAPDRWTDGDADDHAA
jgi:ParB-like chromosome segregation protein Spo0J